MRIFHLLVFLFAINVSLTVCGFAQATVNESLETATLYVDAVKGNDGNPGTSAQPLKTIGAGLSAAITNNHGSVGTKVIVNPGTYRESLTASSSSRDTTLPITIQAATTGTAIVTGAVQYTGWAVYSGNSSIYTNSWLNNFGLCTTSSGGPAAQDIVLRQEMVFINSTPLTQVLSLAQVQHPGAFFVDEKANQIYVWPPSGTNMTTADVEVATQPSLLAVQGHDQFVVRGMVFQYASSCRDQSAVSISGNASNVIFDNDSFAWNNAIGLKMSNLVVNVTISNSSANHNGQTGLGSTQTKSMLWQNVTANYNNWRGAQGAYYFWNSGGTHYFEDHNQTISGMTIAYNQTHGMHWDTDNSNVTASNLTVVNNLLNGLFVEVSEGPVSIDASHVCSNNPAPHDNSAYQGGLALRNSENVSFTNGVIYNNSTANVNVQGVKGGISGSNWETGQTYNLVTQLLTLTSNSIYATGTQYVFSDSYLVSGDWTTFNSTLNSSKNTWWNSTTTQDFKVPTPHAGSADAFSGWQGLTGQDGSSTWSKPADPIASCTVTADAQDYWMISATGALSVTHGKSVTNTYQVVPIGGFNGKVTFSSDAGGATGLTTTFSPTTITGSGTVTVTFAASSTASKGTFPVTILSNNGNINRIATIPVTIN